MATITVEYFGATGTGSTVKEAKADAGRKIERMANATTRVFRFGQYSLVVWPTVHGADYTIISPDDADGRRSFCSCHADMDDATQYGMIHMLTNAREPGSMAIPEWALSYIDAKRVREEWSRNDRFQDAYRRAKENGWNDQQCHEMACNAM